MNKICYTLIGAFMVLCSACEKGVGETIETAYITFPPLPESSYSFNRNGYSSVDVSECGFLKEPMDNMYTQILKQARLGDELYRQEFFQLYNEGLSGLKPKDEIARSPRFAPMRQDILQNIDEMIQISAQIGGYGREDFPQYRARAAVRGDNGFVGRDLADKNLYFIDKRGVAIAEVIKNAWIGCVYVDKIINMHLDEHVWQSDTLRRDHEGDVLLTGKNYTALEHHLDLAYGYYAFLQPFTQSEGIPALKDCHLKIMRALVQSRIALQNYHYDEIAQNIAVIRENLSKALIIRAMYLLVGENTLANLADQPRYAFLALSQAYGLIYALPFARGAEGGAYFSVSEAKEIIDELLGKDGFWEVSRLLDTAGGKGTLQYIALRLGQRMNISIDKIKK